MKDDGTGYNVFVLCPKCGGHGDIILLGALVIQPTQDCDVCGGIGFFDDEDDQRLHAYLLGVNPSV